MFEHTRACVRDLDTCAFLCRGRLQNVAEDAEEVDGDGDGDDDDDGDGDVQQLLRVCACSSRQGL